jgi:hypothetical protein
VSAEVSERPGRAAGRLMGLCESFRSHHSRERLPQTVRDGGMEGNGIALLSQAAEGSDVCLQNLATPGCKVKAVKENLHLL